MYKIDEGKKLITADSDCFQYMGRIDFGDIKRPVLVWPATTVEVNFTGKSIGVVLRNIDFQEYTYFGAVIDGVQQKWRMKNGRKDELYVLAENLPDKLHTLTLIKRMAAQHYVEFVGIVTDNDAEVFSPDHKYDCKVEVYGDSVSAGEVSEALYYVGQCDPEDHKSQYDNAYFSYSMSLCRKLNAELHDIAQGGISLLDGTGYFCSDRLTGMLSCYDKIQYSPYSDTVKWDFSEWNPDIVIIAIGQNDANPCPEKIKEPEYRRMWKDKYIQMLNDIRSHYNEKTIYVMILTLLRHDPTWDDALEEICSELNSPSVHHFKFRRNGAATDGHPRATEHEEMAQELYFYLEDLL